MSKGFLALAAIIALCASALNDTFESTAADANLPADAAYVMLTGNELGSLRPCGCAKHQLGGFEKRAQVWKNIPPERRLLVDTGNLLENRGEQDLIKFDIMIQAFAFLQYDVVNFTNTDFEIAAARGYLEGTTFDVMSSARNDGKVPVAVRRELLVGSEPIAVQIASVEAAPDAAANAAALLGDREPNTLNILIYNQMYDKIDMRELTGVPVDVLVCLSGSDTPEILNPDSAGPTAISVGRYGKYVGRLMIRRSVSGFTLAYEALPVWEELPSDPALVGLYKDYQHIVKEENLLARYPRMPLPGNLEYVGSNSCRVCHEEEYVLCSQMAHAKAWKTLIDAGSQYDPECVVCHVVGLKYEGGFISAKKTPELRDVGCEECHGPGSRHLETLGKAKTEQPQTECAVCHTVENSPEYASHEEEYLAKILHWKEQNDANSVKK